MDITVSEHWTSVDKRDPITKKSKLKLILGLGLMVGIVIAVMILLWQEMLLIDSSGETVEYFFLDFIWTVIITISATVGVLVITYLVLKDCHTLSDAIEGAFLLLLGGLSAAHFIVEGIWFCIIIGSATGDLHTIYAMEIAIQFLLAALALVLVAGGAAIIHGAKKECDVVLRGYSLPTSYVSGGGISARIQCKELKGKKMCKIPRIRSIE